MPGDSPQRISNWFNTDVVAGFVAVAILCVSLLPPAGSVGISTSDTFDHVLAYALLGALATLRRGNMRGIGIAVAGAIGFGGAIEIVQPLFERSCEISDFIANSAGCFIGAAGAALCQRFFIPQQ